MKSTNVIHISVLYYSVVLGLGCTLRNTGPPNCSKSAKIPTISWIPVGIVTKKRLYRKLDFGRYEDFEQCRGMSSTQIIYILFEYIEFKDIYVTITLDWTPIV
jgi:hypothetical protein